MQAMEEMIARAGDCTAAAAHIVRGKRTKRQRLQAAAAVAGTPGGTEAAASSTSSAQFSGSTTATEEEEDMANCLILLARGCSAGSLVVKPEEEVNTAVKPTSRRFAEAATSTNGRAGFYVYECKTCNKCFPSFQALGGHRASHKKPKASIPPPPPPPPPPMAEQAKAAAIYEDCVRLSMNSVCAAGVPAASASGRGSGKQRVHECSICGAEFISGQALGGHMRRHRPASHQESLPPPPEAKNGKRGLSLDLNLPAPSEDDDRFSFASKTPLLLSTSSLIDCHY